MKRSTFAMCLVGVTDSGRDITVAKFQEEKDHREISMASYRLWTGNNAQIDPKVIVQVSVEKKGDNVYMVTGKEPLPQGEFILFTIIPDVAAMTKANTPSSLGGYDFGHHEQSSALEIPHQPSTKNCQLPLCRPSNRNSEDRSDRRVR
jgi:hypothetical protein